MARTTRVVLVCDLHGDGTEAVTTIRMGNGSARYELDLCQSHFDELTGAGRRLRPRRRTGEARSATEAANKTAAGRSWRGPVEWSSGHGSAGWLVVHRSAYSAGVRPPRELWGSVGVVLDAPGFDDDL